MKTGAPVAAFSFAAPPMWSICACVMTIAFTLQLVAFQNRENVVDIVARVDHDGLARLLVAKDRAIALQHAHGQDFVDHMLRSVIFGLIIQ